VDGGTALENGVLSFVLPYLAQEPREWLEINSVWVNHFDRDWTLNDLAKKDKTMHEAHTMNEIHLQVAGMQLDYESARAIADTVACQVMESPMCIAWFDGQKQEEHPAVPECQHKPGWLAYAEGHGGNLMVNLNQGEFIFAFAAIV